MHGQAQLSEDTCELALIRYRLLQPHLEHDRTLRSVADEAGVSFRTLQRWVAQYHRSGLVGLVRKGRGDAGGGRKLSPSLQIVVEGLALERPRLPIVSIQRRISAFADWMGEEPPSYWVVRDHVQHLPENLVTLAHQDPKATARLSTWCIGAKRPLRTQSGRQTMRNSRSCCYARMARLPSPG